MVSVVAFEVIQVLQVVSIFNRRFISTTDLFWSFGSSPAGHRLSLTHVRVMNTFMEMTGSPDPAKVMQMLQSMGLEDQDMDIIEKIGGRL